MAGELILIIDDIAESRLLVNDEITFDRRMLRRLRAYARGPR